MLGAILPILPPAGDLRMQEFQDALHRKNSATCESLFMKGAMGRALQAKRWLHLIPRPSWSSSASCTQSGSRCMRSGSASWTSSDASIIWFAIPKVAPAGLPRANPQRPRRQAHGQAAPRPARPACRNMESAWPARHTLVLESGECVCLLLVLTFCINSTRA